MHGTLLVRKGKYPSRHAGATPWRADSKAEIDEQQPVGIVQLADLSGKFHGS
jgi:hypothetical protein